MVERVIAIFLKMVYSNLSRAVLWQIPISLTARLIYLVIQSRNRNTAIKIFLASSYNATLTVMFKAIFAGYWKRFVRFV